MPVNESDSIHWKPVCFFFFIAENSNVMNSLSFFSFVYHQYAE
jgi:hypothetical protein